MAEPLHETQEATAAVHAAVVLAPAPAPPRRAS